MKPETYNRIPLLLLDQNLALHLLTTEMRLIIILGNSDILPCIRVFSVKLCYWKELRFLNSQKYFHWFEQCHNISFRQIIKIAGLKVSKNSQHCILDFSIFAV